ncbi:MAG TPA: betaine--homocysteine S-methyltransferase [Steroidobacteraceae bacterium]|nr:betaine--homocysteine S-methyltransferase [Steroidobacteraceae bacterium]
MNKLAALLESGKVLLADGATGTNLFAMGLVSGEAPELWNLDHPDRVTRLHQGFVDAGSDILLTNTFGGNARRLMLHGLENRVRAINRIAAQLARAVADAAGRTVVVAGSVGPTGELFEPLGMLTEAAAIEVFEEQIAGLEEGGADVAWIETMSSLEEIRSAALAASRVGIPYTFTASFDTAGRTMMGVTPAALVEFALALDPRPVAIGANCGVGAPDLVMSVLGMTAREAGIPVIAKANAGIPQFVGADIRYSGTPELMARYAHLVADAGARIVGGCCGTSFAHLSAMRSALQSHHPGPRPDEARVVAELGPLQAPGAKGGHHVGRTSRRTRG